MKVFGPGAPIPFESVLKSLPGSDNGRYEQLVFRRIRSIPPKYDLNICDLPINRFIYLSSCPLKRISGFVTTYAQRELFIMWLIGHDIPLNILNSGAIFGRAPVAQLDRAGVS